MKLVNPLIALAVHFMFVVFQQPNWTNVQIFMTRRLKIAQLLVQFYSLKNETPSFFYL